MNCVCVMCSCWPIPTAHSTVHGPSLGDDDTPDCCQALMYDCHSHATGVHCRSTRACARGAAAASVTSVEEALAVLAKYGARKKSKTAKKEKKEKKDKHAKAKKHKKHKS